MSYIPNPIDTSSVEVSKEVLELTEVLAKNAHETWAKQRMSEGWKYGPKRDDDKKEHPCLIPYEELSESEKAYDRGTAMETIKVMLAEGYQIIKE